MTMLSCRETTRLLSEGADRYLSPRERLAVRLHLLMCAPCRRVAAQLRWLRDAVRRRVDRDDFDASIGYADLPPTLRERIRTVATGYAPALSACKKSAARDD